MADYESTSEGKPAGKLLYKFLKNGASAEMNVNGSVTAVNFKYTATDTVLIERVLFYMIDAGIGYGEFGGLGSELTNGLEVKVFNASGVVLVDFMDGLTIKGNSDFAALAGSDVTAADTVGTDCLPVRWTISKCGAPLILSVGEYLNVKVQDNLTGLTKFRAMVQGLKW